MLLILAAVSLSAVFSEKGIFSRAEKAGNKYNEAKAREVLETVLLADGQYEKHTNPKYNQDDFLDELIKSQIEGADVKGDVAIIGEYAYELDRSVPKIGRYLGLAKDLVWPTVTASYQLVNDNRNATITATAKEEKNGINKIEIWFAGEKLYEYNYDNIKTEITTEAYPVYRNGKYIVKAYGKVSDSTTVEVTGIVPAVTFSPNGNREWHKRHTTTVSVDETHTEVISMKYLWTNSQVAPDFTSAQSCTNNGTVTGGDDKMTGKYYLWILLETKTGTTKCNSAEFYFDNEGPTIEKIETAKYSIDGLTITATAKDEKIGVTKFEFYVDNVLKDTQTCNKTKESKTMTSKTITALETGNHNCKVIVYDDEENNSNSSKTGTTKLYTWKTYDTTIVYTKKFGPNESIKSFGIGYFFGKGTITTIPPGSQNISDGVYMFKEKPVFEYKTDTNEMLSCNRR